MITVIWSLSFCFIRTRYLNSWRRNPFHLSLTLLHRQPLDFENGRLVALIVSAQNEVPLVNSLSSWNAVPVEVTVSDVDEGPEFSPLVKVIRVVENTPIGTPLGSYMALDPETRSNAGIRYAVVKQGGGSEITTTIISCFM